MTRILVALLAFLLSSPAAFADNDAIRTGKVIFAKTAGNYTYLRLDEKGKKVWLAASPMEVAVGDTVEYSGGDIFQKFESKAMKKTFDEIRLVTRIHVVKDPPAKGKPLPAAKTEGGAPPGGGKGAAQAPPAKTASATFPGKGEIAKAKNGKTVAELFSGRESLKDSQVAVRGKVIKVSRNILMKNWVTLADGTGAAPDDRIVVVTTENAALGETVTAKGVLKVDVNLGAGYKYKAMIDEAAFVR